MSPTLRTLALALTIAFAAAARVEAQVPSSTGHPPGATSVPVPDGVRSCPGSLASLTTDVGAPVVVLCPDSLDLAAIHNLTDLLSSRIPGVLVQETSGTPGTAARIRIRGSGSIMLEMEPIVILDGVRVLGTPASTSLLAPQLPSRLDDIDVDDIATIEVLRGPATTAMYGTGAAGGVIRMTTKRGRAGAPRVNAFAEAGPVIEPTRYPPNYSQPGTFTSSGEPALNCTLDARARGVCTADESALRSFSPLEQASQFRRGLRQNHGASISGGVEHLSYHAGAGYMHENGVLENSDLARTNLRLNLDARPIDQLALGVSSAYLSAEAHFPKGETHYRSVIVNGLLGASQDDPVNRGYSMPPDSLTIGENRQDVTRLDAAASAHWTALPWLEVAAGVGIDQTYTDDVERVPSSFAPWGEIRTTGTLRVDQQTAGVSITASYPVPVGAVRGSTRIGFDQNRFDFFQGSRTDDGSGFGSSRRRWMNRTNEGLYVHQHLTWLDRLSFDAGIRSDDFQIGSFDSPSRTSGSASVSWLARRAAAGRSASGPLRFHLAYGEVPGTTFSLDFPLVILPPYGPTPRPLKTERTAEFEGGLVTSFLHDRFHLSLTAYRKTTRNAFTGIYDPYYGQETVGNGAELRNVGFEATARAAVIDTRPIKLGVEAGMWRNSNEARSFARGFHYVENGAWQQHAQDFPVAGYWQRRILSYEDLNGDGIISRVNCPGQPQVAGGPACEIEVGSEYEYLGSPIPRFEMFVAPKLMLFGRVHVSALLDYRSGFKQYNQTAASRCGSGRCRAAVDPTAPLHEQARVIAAISGSAGGFDADGGYVEDATFAKLREAAVSLELPRSWTGALGRATLTLAGRNLATWTGYSGFDPEISGSGPLGFAQVETFNQPPLRYYTVRLSVGDR